MKEQNTGEYDALVDEVEKLLAEREEWRARAEQYETAWVRENEANCELTEAITKLRAEREELVNRLTALEDVATAVEADIDCGRPLEYNVEHLRDELIRARAALAKVKGE